MVALNDRLMPVFGDDALTRSNMKAIAELAMPEIEKRRSYPRDDLLTEVIRSDFQGRPMNDEEMGKFISSVLAGGTGTAIVSISFLLLDVLSDRAVRNQL